MVFRLKQTCYGVVRPLGEEEIEETRRRRTELTYLFSKRSTHPFTLIISGCSRNDPMECVSRMFFIVQTSELRLEGSGHTAGKW